MKRKIKTDRQIIYALGFLAILFCGLPSLMAADTQSSNSVAVLDFKVENPTSNQEQIKVAADFMEMALQREGVATLERRQIRLLLGERNLWQGGLISSAAIRAAQLPLPEFFVQGTVRGSESNRFTVDVALVRAGTATLETSFSGEGKFPDEWPGTLDKMARQVASQLKQVRRPPPAQAQFEGITWVPETAFKFFRGIERYACGDYGGALVMFHELRMDDRSSKLAWLWEARCYKQCGLTEQADLIIKKMRLIGEATAQKSVLQNRPVVAVLALSGIPAQTKWKLALRLAASGKVLVFDPEWIGATAREVDLQLTGEMASPPNAGSIWLAVDSVLQLDVITGADGRSHSLRLRQQDLLSGKIVYEETVPSGVSSDDADSERLADQFLKGKAFSQTQGVPAIGKAGGEEPGPQDSATTALAKAVKLVQQDPNNLRFRIGLADCYSPWTGDLNFIGDDLQYPLDYYLKMLCLDQVISAIEKQKEQPEASFWLSSALWRKRTTRITQGWRKNIEGDRWQVPYELEFRPLREWFPQSADYAAFQQLTNYDRSPPRYIQSVFPERADSVYQPKTTVIHPLERTNSGVLSRLALVNGNLRIDPQEISSSWRKASDQSANKHYESAKSFYELIRQSPYVDKAQRLTAAYDLASDYYVQGRFFEASDLLKEIMTETEQGSMRFDRAYREGGGDLRESALALLKKIRLYGDAKLDMNQCCEPSPRIEAPSAEEAAVIEKLFQQWVNAGTPGNETGAEKDAARAALTSHGQAVLPLMIHELELGKVARWQLFWVFSALGSNAAPAIKYILPYVQDTDRGTCMNAMSTLCKIGRPAACALPILVVTAEQDDSHLRNNAEAAIGALSPAPRRTVPYLARLLHHQNPAVCLRSAKEIVATVGWPEIGTPSDSGEQMLFTVRKWWENKGVKQVWNPDLQ